MIKYKGFTIIEDRLLGWSLIDRFGNWAKSATSVQNLKDTIDRILGLTLNCVHDIEYSSATLGFCKKCGKKLDLLDK